MFYGARFDFLTLIMKPSDVKCSILCSSVKRHSTGGLLNCILMKVLFQLQNGV